eukprot:scaffold94199_cov56-Phaeocystis_antarctica.AAC.1
MKSHSYSLALLLLPLYYRYYYTYYEDLRVDEECDEEADLARAVGGGMRAHLLRVRVGGGMRAHLLRVRVRVSRRWRHASTPA